jgi:hypothetical protein
MRHIISGALYRDAPLGIKTEQKQKELTGAVTIIIFFTEAERNTETSKQIWTEYGADMHNKRMITKTKRCLESCKKPQATQVLVSICIMIARCNGEWRMGSLGGSI